LEAEKRGVESERLGVVGGLKMGKRGQGNSLVKWKWGGGDEESPPGWGGRLMGIGGILKKGREGADSIPQELTL